jgi:16S rRNA (cytidine1402-2'-O)-methyltransferase
MGTLYVVGTPIGNLEDLTARAQRVLKEVDLIAAEDTRVTRVLLGHWGIQKPLVAYTDAYDRHKQQRLDRVLEALGQGRAVALVTDAGMPGLADPGHELIRAALARGHDVSVVPGPSAILTALVASGLPSDRFTFVGYLPRQASARRKLLAELADEPGSLIAFESPRRLSLSLADLLQTLGNRPIAVARELTKRFEEVWRGDLVEAVEAPALREVRGEVTLVIGGTGRARAADQWAESQVRHAIALLQQEGLAPAAIARVVSRLAGWSRGDVYALVAGASQATARSD